MFRNCSNMNHITISRQISFENGPPPNFAEILLDHEMDLDYNLTLEKVSRLMELYSVNFI